MGVQSYIISTCQLSALRHSSVILGLWSDISGGGQLLFSPCSQAHRSLRRAVESPKPARSDRVGGGRLRECSLWTCSTDCYVTAPSPADSVEAEHVSESRPRFDLKVGHVSTLPRAGLWVYLFFYLIYKLHAWNTWPSSTQARTRCMNSDQVVLISGFGELPAFTNFAVLWVRVTQFTSYPFVILAYHTIFIMSLKLCTKST